MVECRLSGRPIEGEYEQLFFYDSVEFGAG